VENAVIRSLLQFSLVWLALAGVSPAALAAVHVLVVSGLGGEPEYEKRFVEQANAVAAAALRVTGDSKRVIALTGKDATRDSIRAQLRALAKQLTKDDQIAIVLIGHGSFDGDEYRFNLPGPDLTGTELAALFDRLPAGQQLIVNTTSSSGAVIERWKRANRTVITATKSGGERNATRFAEYWVQALASPEADRDKNQRITVAEAFEFASRRVADAFKADAALATEHARMEGGNPARFLVARLGNAADFPSDSVLEAMMNEQSGIERQIEELKGQKESMDRDTYYNELEKVLIALARLDRSIDQRRAMLSGGGPNAAKPE
jgi:hypothetical protein